MALTDNQKGAAMISGSMAGFATSDTLFQLIAPLVVLPQFIFLRGIFVTLGMGFLVRRSRKAFPQDKRVLGLIILRGFVEVLVAFCFLFSLTKLPLAEATAINQTTPLVLAVCGYFLFGEKFGWRRITAVLGAFVGVLLIIKPGFSGSSPYYFLVVLAVVLITIRDLIVRFVPKDVGSIWVAFFTVSMVTLASGIVSLTVDYKAISLATFGVIFACAMVVICAQLLIVLAMRTGEVSLVGAFRYSAILFTVLIDRFVFHRTLDVWSLLGCAMVAASGVFMLLREKQKAELEMANGE